MRKLLLFLLLPLQVMAAEGPFICNNWESPGVCHPKTGDLVGAYLASMDSNGFWLDNIIDHTDKQESFIWNYKSIRFKNDPGQIIVVQCDQLCPRTSKCPIGMARDPSDNATCKNITDGPYSCDGAVWDLQTLCDAETGELLPEAVQNRADFGWDYINTDKWTEIRYFPHEIPPTSRLYNQQQMKFNDGVRDSTPGCTQQCLPVAECAAGEAPDRFEICTAYTAEIQSESRIYNQRDRAALGAVLQAREQGQIDLKYGAILYAVGNQQVLYSDLIEGAPASTMAGVAEELEAAGHLLVGYVHTNPDPDPNVIDGPTDDDYVYAQQLADQYGMVYFAVYTRQNMLIKYRGDGATGSICKIPFNQ